MVALAPLDALGPDIAETISDAEDALRLIGTVVREHPEVAAVIVNVLEQKNRADWADQIRQMANLNSRIELTS